MLVLFFEEVAHFLGCGAVGETPQKKGAVLVEGTWGTADGDLVLLLVLVLGDLGEGILWGGHLQVAVILSCTFLLD
jgi:hypothetical protein